MYRYLVTMPNEAPFFTDNFKSENHYEYGMIVYDLKAGVYTMDGTHWLTLEVDHL